MQIPELLKPCYERTFRIKTPRGAASSSFILSYRDRPWLVMARHVLDNLNDNERFTVQEPDGAVHTEDELVALERHNPAADVAVYTVWPGYVDVEPLLEPYEGVDGSRIAESVCLAERVRFLGFPKLHRGLGNNYRSPLVRSAIISGQARATSGICVWVLDGMANPGFSGGPVLIQEHDSGPWRVLGVASHFVSEIESAFSEVDSSEEQDSAHEIDSSCEVADSSQDDSPDDDDSPFGGAIHVVLRNAGLAICIDIRHAIADIDKHLAGQSEDSSA